MLTKRQNVQGDNMLTEGRNVQGDRFKNELKLIEVLTVC